MIDLNSYKAKMGGPLWNLVEGAIVVIFNMKLMENCKPVSNVTVVSASI